MLNARRFAAFLLLALTFSATCSAGEKVVVRVKQGRKFHGCVHARSTQEVLWVESCGSATKLLRPIRWADIEEVSLADANRPLSVEQARTTIAQLARTGAPATRILQAADASQMTYAEQALFLLGFSN